ncbi:LytR family transcriptional regulator, partial [Rhodococcus sp. 05-2254-6]
MGDDRESGPSVPEGRAPWERPLSSIRQTGSIGRSGQRPPHSEQPATPDEEQPPQPGDSGRLGKRSPRNADTVSVAELVDKMSRSGSTRRVPDDRPEVEEPTEVIAPITDSTPPPARAVPPTPPPHAAPEPVGAPATDRPALTRLAMSRVRRRRRVRMIGRSLVSLVAILAVALTGVVWGYLRNTDQGFLQVAALDPDSTDVVDAEGQYGDETYLIVGTDTRTGASGEVGAG